MTKTHATLISLLLGLAVVLGMFAAVRTTSLAARSSSADTASVVQRQQRLNRAEAQLRHALARRPPTLPAASRRPAPVAAPRIAYVRPAPIVAPPASSGDHGDDEEHGAEKEGFDD